MSLSPVIFKYDVFGYYTSEINLSLFFQIINFIADNLKSKTTVLKRKLVEDNFDQLIPVRLRQLTYTYVVHFNDKNIKIMIVIKKYH